MLNKLINISRILNYYIVLFICSLTIFCILMSSKGWSSSRKNVSLVDSSKRVLSPRTTKPSTHKSINAISSTNKEISKSLLDSSRKGSQLTASVINRRALPNQAEPQPVGHWKLDEGIGSITKDASGNGNTGTVYGSSWTSGKFSKALKFDGIDDYVKVPRSSSLVVKDEATISAWLYPEVPGSDMYGGLIVGKNGEYEIARFADGTIQWKLANINPGFTWINTGYVVDVNAWTHITIVYEKGNVRTYANGVFVHGYVGEGDIIDTTPENNELSIGGSDSNTKQYFKGRIDDVRIYNTALSLSDIQSLNNLPLQTLNKQQNTPLPKSSVSNEDQSSDDTAVGSTTSFVSGKTLGTPSTGNSGWVGMRITTGASPVIVTALGRIYINGNTGSTTVKIVNASDLTDVPGGAATVPLSSGINNEFNYGELPTPITLNANTSYYIVSQEDGAGNTWYDDTQLSITSSDVAVVDRGIEYFAGSPGNSSRWTLGTTINPIGPVDFKYITNGYPIVKVTAIDAKAAEMGLDVARFTFTRVGNTSNSIIVKYDISGTTKSGDDYDPLPTTVIIPSGETTASINLIPVDDTEKEGNETITISLQAGEGYNIGVSYKATATIIDNETRALLKDDFNDNNLNPSLWEIYDPASPVQVNEVDQRFEITLKPNIPSYNGIVSVTSFDFNDKILQVTVPRFTNGNMITAESAETSISLYVDGNETNGYVISKSWGMAYFTAYNAGKPDQTSLTLDPVLHRYLRIRHNSAEKKIYFEASTDFKKWVIMKSVEAVFPLDSMKVRLQASAWTTKNTDPGIAAFDDFKILGLPPTVSLTSPANNSNILGDSVTLQASAVDLYDVIDRVEFYQGDAKLGESKNNNNYSYNWIDIPPGKYTLTAKAIDIDGNSINSDAVVCTFFFEDVDGDGLPDTWERRFFGDLSQSANGDYDGDGTSNMDEFKQGRDPSKRSVADGNIQFQIHTLLDNLR
jgi:hypothetical protein